MKVAMDYQPPRRYIVWEYRKKEEKRWKSVVYHKLGHKAFVLDAFGCIAIITPDNEINVNARI